MKYKNVIISVCIFSLCFFIRLYFSDLYKSSQLVSFVGQKISVVGIVVDEPDVREHNVKLTVRLSEVRYASTTAYVAEKILVTVPSYPEFSYGDKVRMNVLLIEPKPIDTDGRVFNYSAYLRVRGIWYTSKFTTVSFLESGHGSNIKNVLFKTKHIFTEAINRALPAPKSNLMAGLLLGTKQSLGKELLSEFQRSGVSHVVVLSGYNIVIVAQSVMSLLSFLPHTFSFGFGCLGIILFTMLSGGGASAWRAAIMVLVALFAKQTNREYSAAIGFCIAVVVMLLLNPLLLFLTHLFNYLCWRQSESFLFLRW